MNPENSYQIHRTTEAIGTDQTPTPVKGHISKHEDGSYYITAEGADGQQVADLIISALRQMPENRKQSASGVFEFCAGLVFFSLLAAGLVNVINWIIQPPPQTTINQVQKR